MNERRASYVKSVWVRRAQSTEHRAQSNSKRAQQMGAAAAEDRAGGRECGKEGKGCRQCSRADKRGIRLRPNLSRSHRNPE